MINIVQGENKIQSGDIVKAGEKQKKRTLETSHITEKNQLVGMVKAKEKREIKDVDEQREAKGLGPNKRKEKAIFVLTREERVSVLKT